MPVLKRKDVLLDYELKGSGPPVLLIQGIGVTGSGWKPQVDALSASFSTLAFDNRGIGKSLPCTGPITIGAMADDALALMNEVGWESAHVVGHSMGGVIAQQLAIAAPKRVRSLSLLCTFARGKDGGRITPWVLWMSLRTRIGTRTARRRAFLEMIFPEHHLRGTDPDRLAAELAPILGRDLADQPPVLMKQLMALGSHDASARLSTLNGIPTLVVSGHHDRIAKPEYGRMIADRIHGARFEVIPDASHALMIQKPEQVNAMLSGFLSSV